MNAYLVLILFMLFLSLILQLVELGILIHNKLLILKKIKEEKYKSINFTHSVGYNISDK